MVRHFGGLSSRASQRRAVVPSPAADRLGGQQLALSTCPDCGRLLRLLETATAPEAIARSLRAAGSRVHEGGVSPAELLGIQGPLLLVGPTSAPRRAGERVMACSELEVDVASREIGNSGPAGARVVRWHGLTPGRKTKTQVYLGVDELRALHQAAARLGRPLASLMRAVVRARYLSAPADGPVAIWDGEFARSSADHDAAFDEAR